MKDLLVSESGIVGVISSREDKKLASVSPPVPVPLSPSTNTSGDISSAILR